MDVEGTSVRNGEEMSCLTLRRREYISRGETVGYYCKSIDASLIVYIGRSLYPG